MQKVRKEGKKYEEEKNEKDYQGNKERDEQIKETGQLLLEDNGKEYRIHLITIIGEIEGHDILSSNTKTTKYEHVLPKLASIEDAADVDGVLILLNTMGGDVEAGLAIAEMIASLSKPTVSLVLGGSHSIGVPIAVSSKYSFIVPSGTMVVHPVRMNGMVIGSQITYDYFQQIQDRITNFVCSHCGINKKKFEELLSDTGMMTKDIGTILVGKQAVECGIINEVGGIKDALKKLNKMIEKSKIKRL